MFCNVSIDFPNNDNDAFKMFIEEVMKRLKGGTLHADETSHKLQVTFYLRNHGFISQMDSVKDAVRAVRKIMNLQKFVHMQFTCQSTTHV